jgi:hypothetical protein
VPKEAEPPVRRGANSAGAGRADIAAYARMPAARIAGAIALTIVAAGVVVVWLATRDGTEADSSRRATATTVSIRRLNAFAASLPHPVYWAGPQPRFTYELSRTKDGRVYIRYLPPGVRAGDPNPNYLTVGTYPQRDAFATVRATAKKQGARTIRLAGGGLAFQDENRPASVYVAFPGSDFQIEVYAPSPGTARTLVASGQIKAVGAPPRAPSGSNAASVQDLRRLAAVIGHPIYWAGAEPGITYELTRTRDGSVYIRYLPAGVAVGTRRADYLTVVTYRQQNALDILKRTATRNGVDTIELDSGGLALVDGKHPTSVYIAYPAADVQIEVYDASPGRARQLVTSHRIVPLP